MADVYFDGMVIVADNNCMFQSGHPVSLLKKDLIEFLGDGSSKIYSSATDELTLCLWKASALRSVPVEGGCFVVVNLLENFPAVGTLQTLCLPVTPTWNSCTDRKFMPLFCSAYYCGISGLFNQEPVVCRLCAKVPELDRVVLGAETVEAFRWASGESFRTELKEIISKWTLLCKESCSFNISTSHFNLNDHAGFWQKLYVINCVPVCQGRLTDSSEIVIKCYSRKCAVSDMPRHNFNNCYSSHSDTDADTEAVMVSDFAVDIANKCSFLTSQTLGACSGKLYENVPAHELNLTILRDIDRIRSLITIRHSQNSCDEFSVAVFSRQCASRLGIMSDNVLELLCKSHETDHQHVCRRKLVIACVDTRHNLDDMVVYISSCAWFNLCSMSCLSLTGTCDIRPCYVKVCLILMHLLCGAHFASYFLIQLTGLLITPYLEGQS